MKEISFPTRTPVPAIRCRSSQGVLRANFLGALALLFVASQSLCSAAQSVTLSWSANSEPDIAGYKVYYRAVAATLSEVVDVGNTTTFTVPNLGDGITYLFSVTAYNFGALESRPSNEVSYTTSEALRSVTLVWNANSEPDIAGYKVHYGPASGTPTQTIDVGNTTTATIHDLNPDTTYFFTVTAYNSTSLESQPSNEVSSSTSSLSEITLLTVNNGTGGGNYPVGTLVVVIANAPPEGSQFAGWTGDVPILSNPSASATTATIPSLDVTITATYSASD